MSRVTESESFGIILYMFCGSSSDLPVEDEIQTQKSSCEKGKWVA